MDELIRKLTLQKLIQGGQTELNEPTKDEKFPAYEPKDLEDTQKENPVQLTQEEPSRWQKLIQFLQPKESPEPTPIDPNAPTVTDAIRGVLQRKQLEEQLKKQLGS